MDIAESRVINNRQNNFLGNFNGLGYGNIKGGATNLQGINQFQSNFLNQMSNNGNYQLGLSNGMNTNPVVPTTLSQQGAKFKNQNQDLLQLHQQNQRLQHVRLLQKQQIQQQEKLNKVKRKQFSNTYTSNNDQNDSFSKTKSNNKIVKPSNTFRKSDTQKSGIGNSIANNYGLYDYDVDYYDLG